MLNDPSALQTIAVLSVIEQQLNGAIEQLGNVCAHAAGLARRTDWRTDAATRFHAGADSWGHDVAGLAGFVEDARNEVSAARVRIELRVWSPAE